MPIAMPIVLPSRNPNIKRKHVAPKSPVVAFHCENERATSSTDLGDGTNRAFTRPEAASTVQPMSKAIIVDHRHGFTTSSSSEKLLVPCAEARRTLRPLTISYPSVFRTERGLYRVGE